MKGYTTVLMRSQTISYDLIKSAFSQMSKVQRALTGLQTAVGAISLKTRFTQAADPEQTVCLIVALTALLRDGAWTDKQMEHTDKLKILGKITQHQTMGQIPPGGLGSRPTWLCATALMSPRLVIQTVC